MNFDSCVATPLLCSGNGQCINNTVCLCRSELFTGRSDWVNGEGIDCQIVLPVIWAFWSLNLLEIMIVSYIALPILRRLYLHHVKVRENQRQKGNSYTIRENLGLFSILPFWSVSLPTHTALAVFKLAQRDSRLGLDLALTVLWLLSRVAADLSLTSARAALTVSTMQSEGASPGAIFKREMMIWTMFGLSAASSFMVWPVYTTGGRDMILAQGLFSAHFLFASLSAGFNAYISHGLGRSVYSSLTDSFEKLKDDRILQVRDDLVRSQTIERNLSSLVCVCYLLLGAIPRLWITHDYFWCVLWLIWPYLGLSAVLTLDKAQKSARGDKARDKLIASLRVNGSEDEHRLSVTHQSDPSDLKTNFTKTWGWAFRSSTRMSKQVSGGSEN